MMTEHTDEKIYVGLDIGTTKVCAIVASVDASGGVNILGVGKAPSEGINRGVVVNIDKTVNAIKTAIEQAELASGIQVDSVYVGIAGDHIQSIANSDKITITNKDSEIRKEDVKRLIDKCQNIILPPDQHILHVIPQEFVVDGQDGATDPVGMIGKSLEAEVRIVTGLVTAAKNMHKCVQRAGYRVADIILEPLASSYAVLDPEEKEAGVVLVDIGGGTSDVAVFRDNTIRHTAVIAIAGQKVTDDIKIGLSVLEDQAMRLKHDHGFAYQDLIQEDETITVPGIAGRPPKEIRKSVLSNIIQARAEEILEIVGIELRRSGYMDSLSAGVVLTGGGSLLGGLAPLATEILGMDAKIGHPRGISGGLVSEVNSPIYSTGVGLVLYAISTDPTKGGKGGGFLKASEGGNTMKAWTKKMKNWFNEF